MRGPARLGRPNKVIVALFRGNKNAKLTQHHLERERLRERHVERERERERERQRETESEKVRDRK
jgi:hypothetical protein